MKLIYCTAWIAVMSIVLSCNQSTSESKSPQLANRNIILPESKQFETSLKDGIIGFTGDQTADSTAKQEPPGNGSPRKQPATPQQNIDWDKKIIKNASINAEVKDYKSFYAS